MTDPISLSVAKALSGAVTKAATPRLQRALLGREDQRALDAVFRAAFEQALAQLAPGPEQLRDLQSVLHDFFGDPEVSGALVEVALARRPPDAAKLRDRLWALGFDPATFPLDLGALIAALADHLTDALRTHAQRPESALFNAVALAELEGLRTGLAELRAAPAAVAGQAPPVPGIVVGREAAVRDLKARLRLGEAATGAPATQVITAVRGWPGVGKTTLAAALAHDPEISVAFPDGVLWATLTRPERVGVELAAWGRVLGLTAAGVLPIPELSAAIAGVLRDRRMLLVIDDVWAAEDAQPLRVGGRGCALLVTTRVTEVAAALAPTAADVYRLDVLDEASALSLLQRLAPGAADERSLRELVAALEGLPLALQVAGHLLREDGELGLGVDALLAGLHAGTRLLEADAPADRRILADETTPTVAALLRQSTDRLPPQDRDRFALLGAFAPKPATFAVEALTSVWEVEDPVPTIRRLVRLGLLEPMGDRRFELHAVLVMHAQTMLEPV